ncbi:MAG: hypothetical protein H6832_13335 [Planctomycetes bacterium]|nr:hypothetical protein [Planctomycetota bacterium]MCB9919380.1 hypothetical protein [Planctomycetota bacterium]
MQHRNPKAALLVVVAAVVAATTAVSQSIVLPKGRGVPNVLDGTEGNSGLHLPGRQAPSRVLTVYRGADLGITGPTFTMRSIAYRRDAQRTTAFKAHQFKVTIELSTIGVPVPAMLADDSFDAAHGRNRTKVVDNKTVDWPAAPLPINPPAPFAPKIVFDSPFVLTSGLNLCVDVQSAPLGANAESHYWYVDAESFDRSSVVGTTRNLGRGCPIGFQLRVASPQIDGETPIHAWTWTRATQSSRTFLAIGDTSTKWNGQNLPFDLVGASGCRLYVAPLVVDITASGNDSRGTARFGIPGPAARDARFVGMTLHLQAFVEDSTIGPLGLRASSWVEAKLGQLGEPLPARTIYDSGPVVDDVPTASLDLGPVIEIGT